MAKKPLFRIGAFPRAAAAIAVLSADGRRDQGHGGAISGLRGGVPALRLRARARKRHAPARAPGLAEPRNCYREWRPGPHRGPDGDDFLLRAQPVAACRDLGADLPVADVRGAVRRAAARRAARPAHLHGACRGLHRRSGGGLGSIRCRSRGSLARRRRCGARGRGLLRLRPRAAAGAGAARPDGLHRVLPEPRPGADHRPLRLCGMANAGSRRSRLVRADRRCSASAGTS